MGRPEPFPIPAIHGHMGGHPCPPFRYGPAPKKAPPNGGALILYPVTLLFDVGSYCLKHYFPWLRPSLRSTPQPDVLSLHLQARARLRTIFTRRAIHGPPKRGQVTGQHLWPLFVRPHSRELNPHPPPFFTRPMFSTAGRRRFVMFFRR